jgi:hypothetical protein
MRTLELVIFITNETMEEWITSYNMHASRHSRGGVNGRAVSRRFGNIIESQETIDAWQLTATNHIESFWSTRNKRVDK